MPEGDDYPRILSNRGFPVTALEAKIMARIARNLVVIQRSLPEENRPESAAQATGVITKEDILPAMMRGLFGGEKVWPVKMRDDFVDKYEAFAPWAEQSRGFRIR
jgi:hypothetical protein